MKKTKQILIGYLTVVALLLTTSCEKELYEDAINQNSNKQLAIKKISFTEFRKNRKAFLAFKNAISEAASNDNLARGVYNAEFDAVIDTSNIVLIEKNNTKSITIKIIDEDPTKDENIVLLTTNQNDYTAYKTEYILSQQEILTLNQGQNITNKTPNSVTNLETQNRSISNSCFDFNVYTVLMCRDRNGNAIYTQGNLGDNCVGMSFDVDYFILSVNANCLSSSGGFSWNPVNGTGNNNNNSNNNGANDNNGGVSSGNDYGGGFSGTGGLPNNNNPLNTDSEFLTTPLLSSSTSIGRLLNFLTENQANFFFHGLDGEAQISIVNYIDENTDRNGVVNSQAREFVKEAINTLEEGGEVDFILQIILDPSFKNNPCLNGVYENMVQNSPTANNYLNNFDSSMSATNLMLASSNTLSPNTNAVTSPPQNYLIKITFNSNNLDRSQLSIARTFIHELIHAEIFRKLLSISNHPSINLTLTELYQNKENFPGLYDYYSRYTLNTTQLSDPQHQMMAQHYRDIISDAIKEFDNNQHSQDVYDALAWVGLMGEGSINMTTGLTSNPTVAWQNLTSTQRINIINTVTTFESSNTNCQ